MGTGGVTVALPSCSARNATPIACYSTLGSCCAVMPDIVNRETITALLLTDERRDAVAARKR